MGEVDSYTKTGLDALLAAIGGGTDFVADVDGPRIPFKNGVGDIIGYLGWSSVSNGLVLWIGDDAKTLDGHDAARLLFYNGELFLRGQDISSELRLGDTLLRLSTNENLGLKVQNGLVHLGNIFSAGVNGTATPATSSDLADVLVALGVIASHSIGDFVTQSDIDAAIAALVASAPGTLNTLNEIATALGNDPNLAATLTAAIGTKLAKASNLSDLTDASAARTNLGLGALATKSVVAVGDLAFDPATQTELDTHEADTTNVHGFADTNGIMRVVVHGSTAGTARPAGGASIVVHWIGSVAPTNAIDNDIWTDNS